MAASFLNSLGLRTVGLLLAGCCAIGPADAREVFAARDPAAPIIINAESSEFDYAANRLVFHGLRLYQGEFGIVADHAVTDELNFEDGIWVFTGNVEFKTDTATLRCDEAEIRFLEHELAEADMQGAPAWFEQVTPEEGKVNSGEAIFIVYRLTEGTLELRKEASFTDGKNSVAGDLITYDMQAQNLSAGAGDSGPVKIIIEPRNRNKDEKDKEDK